MQLYTNKVAVVFILLTKNNIIFSLTNLNGEVLFWTSAGSTRIKGIKKSVSTTVYSSVLQLIQYIQKNNFSFLHIKLKGLNKSKKLIIKVLTQTNLNLISLQDTTAFPHNGCRTKKKRHV